MKPTVLFLTLAAAFAVIATEPDGPYPLRPDNPKPTNSWATNQPGTTNRIETNRPVPPPKIPTNTLPPFKPVPPRQPAPPTNPPPR